MLEPATIGNADSGHREPPLPQMALLRYRGLYDYIDAAENAAIWLSAAISPALLTIAVVLKAINEQVGYLVVLGALITAILYRICRAPTLLCLQVLGGF